MTAASTDAVHTVDADTVLSLLPARPPPSPDCPPRVTQWFGYAPLDPAQVLDTDGIVFVRDTLRR
ncbi:hypothetical protein ABZS77_22330 [Micromonospora sp. NPDC005298]|uniref:hypothetical protein n=1 Tax=Micromonospora sp. NPDC005298 TaxID=3156873 RepID=UPI0033A64B0A